MIKISKQGKSLTGKKHENGVVYLL